VINEDPSVRMINDLRAENEKLKLALEVASSHNFNNSSSCDSPTSVVTHVVGVARSPTVPRRAFFPDELADDDADVEVAGAEYGSTQQVQADVEPSKVCCCLFDYMIHYH
jgi:hypothetical protein